ncbi:MAG: carbohydrate-binding domain-containing protein [Alkalibacterium sp.]|nr:carbohydrate-binding domain-containing protein [Alkalibacterium sp.]
MNVDNALQISGLDASNDVSEGNYWANVRLSSDNYTPEVDILGAEELTIDVIVDEPATVSIAAIPQNGTHGWVKSAKSCYRSPRMTSNCQGGGATL